MNRTEFEALRDWTGKVIAGDIRFSNRTALRPVLEVDGTNHDAAGRSHKHALATERCPDRNLPEATARPELAGRSMREVFDAFCGLAGIAFRGQFFPPEETG